MSGHLVSRGATSDPASLASGTRFGTYRVERLIGTGGMGSVYEATHVGLKKRVALKILHQTFLNNDEVIARFLREGEATARINHPNVVDVTDLGVKDGLPYLVMELLVGESLADKLGREKMMPVERAVDVLLPIISAVGMAHDEGVVHRDLKPDNIFLAKNRLGLIESKLLDFGISKMTTRSELTTAASVLGTPHYLSPEQAQALRDIDGRSDQYSIAVILYRLVTGMLPVGGDVVMDILMAVAQGRVRPPRAVKFDLSDVLERIIMRGLATSPKDRFPHIHLMGCELLPFASVEGRAAWHAHFEMRAEELIGGAATVVGPVVPAPMPSSPSMPAVPAPVPMTMPMPPLAPGPISAPIAVPAGMRPTPAAGTRIPITAPIGAQPALGAHASAPTSTPVPSRPPSPPGLREPVKRGPNDDDGSSRAFSSDALVGEPLYGARWPMGVLGAALLGALLVIGGGLWWISMRDAPVNIPAASERPVATYRVSVAVEPDGAEIAIDGKPRGHGKLDIELPVDGNEHVFEAKMEGYETVTLPFRQGSVLPDRVKLEKN